MARISMDLLLAADGTGIASQEKRTLMTEACVEVLKRLGPLASAIDAFRITFPADQAAQSRVAIEIHFSDPLGTKCSHSLMHDFRGGVEDTVEDISDHMCHGNFLSGAVRAHLERGHKKFMAAEKQFAKFRG